MNGGVLPNGLFWTAQVPKSSFRELGLGRAALLRLRNQPLVDTFQFGGPFAIPASVSTTVFWRAVEERMERGLGTTVDPTDPAAFRGRFAEATCMGRASAAETGFSFKSGPLTAKAFFAEIGEERNGAFL